MYKQTDKQAQNLQFFGAKQCQTFHPHRQTINICLFYAKNNNNNSNNSDSNSKYLQQPTGGYVGSLLTANVRLQVAFWAKPHSQLIATTTTSSWQQLPVAGAQKCGLGRNTAAAWKKYSKKELKTYFNLCAL